MKVRPGFHYRPSGRYRGDLVDLKSAYCRSSIREEPIENRDGQFSLVKLEAETHVVFKFLEAFKRPQRVLPKCLKLTGRTKKGLNLAFSRVPWQTAERGSGQRSCRTGYLQAQRVK
jgi:hypothetical protein